MPGWWKGKRLQRAKTHYVTLAQSPLNVAAVPHWVLGDFGSLLEGTEPGFRAGCEAVGCHSCIHIHGAESCCPALWDSSFIKLGLFHSNSKKQLGASLELQPLPKKGDLRSSTAGKETIWFASWGCWTRKSQQKQSYSVLFLCHSSASLQLKEKYFKF